MRPDQEPTPAEQRDAVRLSRLLEGEELAPGPVAEELAAARLLLHPVRGELTPERATAVWQRIAAVTPEGRPAPADRARPGRWLALGAAALAAGATAAVLLTFSGPPAATPLPPPGLALLTAQAKLAQGEPAPPELEHLRQAYRTEVHAALAARYGRDR